MPTASELINTAKMSQKTTDEKMAELREIINGLMLRVSLLEKEVTQLSKPKTEEEAKPEKKEFNTDVPITCRRCGRKGHWTLGCNTKTDVNGVKLYTDEDYESE